MVKWVLAWVLSHIAVTCMAAESCAHVERAYTHKGYELVGYTDQGIAGFLVNPGFNPPRRIGQAGVWFPPDTWFEIYPNLTIVSDGTSRVLVKSQSGTFAELRLKDLLCPDQEAPSVTAVANDLISGPRVLVGRVGVSREQSSSLTTACDETLTIEGKDKVSWEIAVPEFLKLGGEVERTLTVQYSKDTSKTIYLFHRPDTDVTVILRIVQSCDGGTVDNNPRWEISVSDQGSVTLLPHKPPVDSLTFSPQILRRPLISCQTQQQALFDIFAQTPLPVEFYNVVAGVMAHWSRFREFQICL